VEDEFNAQGSENLPSAGLGGSPAAEPEAESEEITE
jgi:hypothetical protein